MSVLLELASAVVVAMLIVFVALTAWLGYLFLKPLFSVDRGDRASADVVGSTRESESRRRTSGAIYLAWIFASMLLTTLAIVLMITPPVDAIPIQVQFAIGGVGILVALCVLFIGARGLVLGRSVAR